MSRRAIQREDPKYKVETVSRVYANVNKERGPEWYDIENWTIPVDGNLEPYELVDWIGTGKYSDVFTAWRNGNELVAIKILKPVRPQKYNREAKILLNLRDGPNIVRLIEIIQNPINLQYSLVSEYVQDTDFYKLLPTMSLDEIAFYLFQLMRALQFAHSRGIMHRDVKPLNILYDRQHKKVRLIDWGLAEFYHPGERYNIHVASRNYKPPELLLDYQLYDYSIDIWSFGVTMAGMIFGKNPFFGGNEDLDVLENQVACLGTDSLHAYLKKYNIPLPSNVDIRRCPAAPRKLSTYKNSHNQQNITPAAIDLIEKCLKFDHTERITADEALMHPFFDSVRSLPAN